jgi:1-acyl-sn-glycerol-3-phosphate acyltransferase
VATAVFILPFVFLAPLNGCLSNALPRRWVLMGSSLFTLLVVGGFTLTNGPWLGCLFVVALGAAVNSPARYALLPAAAADARVPLPRVNGWIEMGAAAAIVGSVALGSLLPLPGWPSDGAPLAGRAVAVLLGLNLLSLVTALPTTFPSDTRRPERPWSAVAGFFRDARRVVSERSASLPLVGLAGFQALVTAGTGAIFAYLAKKDLVASLEDMARPVVAAGLGAVLGCGASALVGHPRRSLGLVPLGSTGLVVALLWAMVVTQPGQTLPLTPCLALGFFSGLVNVPLRAAYLGAVPADARGNATSVMNVMIYVMTAFLAGLVIGMVALGILRTPQAQLGLVLAVAIGAAALAWAWLWMPMLELPVAGLLTLLYRVRPHGPGVGRVPARGPLLVVANHSAYPDPFWLGMVLPRKLTPMMTSQFYDLPGIHWASAHLAGAIRVPAGHFRRDAPELQEAAAKLRSGGAVLVFPEGILRRKEEMPLRLFGQGVWRILQEAPQTPVVVCWIEGGWGSYFSYKGGPPMKNKRFDLRRQIDVAVADPQVLDVALLADGRATRAYLAQACLACRGYLGLEVPSLGREVHENEEEIRAIT